MVHYYKLFWLNAFNIHGRSRRKEFWYPVLVTIIITLIAEITLINLVFLETYFMPFLSTPIYLVELVFQIFQIASLIAFFSLTVRRFHDLNMTLTYPVITYAITILYKITDNIIYVTDFDSPLGLFLALLGINCLILNLIVLFMACRDGHKGENKYGINPNHN